MIGQRSQRSVTALGSRLTETVGVGPVIAGRLLGRTGRASRFPTAPHFASYTGAAPVEVASGERARHRLSRAGDRQLNHALHIIALVQVGTPGCAGYHYFRRKLAEGKTTREAMRCLKRRIADLASHAQRRTGPQPPPTPGGLTDRGAHRRSGQADPAQPSGHNRTWGLRRC